MMAMKFNNYVLYFNILDHKKSGFRKLHMFYSTETTLFSLADNMLWTIDHTNNIQLLLLDLSSAFDRIKHDLLIDHLK